MNIAVNIMCTTIVFSIKFLSSSDKHVRTLHFETHFKSILNWGGEQDFSMSVFVG